MSLRSPSTRRPAVRPRRLFFVLLPVALAACVSPPEIPAAVAGDERARPTASMLEKVAREEKSPLLSRLAREQDVVEAPLKQGNDARLLIDGPEAMAAMLQAIRGARRQVHLETYILESLPELDEALRAKRAQGVEVAVLYDSVGSLTAPREFFDGLKAAGIALCEFNPVNPLKAQAGWELNNRNHRKVLVVDGRLAFTGGINISRVYSSSSSAMKRKAPSREEGWRDTHVRIAGPVVADFQRLFLDTWATQKCPPLAAKDSFPPLPRAGDKAMRMLAADPSAGRSETYAVLLQAIANAGRRIWLTYGYFVPDERMLQALAEAAGRGVDVRLVLPGFSDFWAPFHAGRARYGELLARGVRIYERRDALLHAKTAVIDGTWTNVGSTNLDWRSFASNYEADIVVLDRDFAGQMERLFQTDVAASHEVTLAEWEGRGLGERLKEWVARWWERLL